MKVLERRHVHVQLVDKVLRERGESELGVAHYLAATGLQLARENLEQRRLAATVRTHECHARFEIDANVHVAASFTTISKSANAIGERASE